MYDRILRTMRDKVREQDYVVTTHADEEMDEDGLTIGDVERAILRGEIVTRQRDQHSRGWKYVLEGGALDSRPVAVVAKLGFTGKLVIITVFLT